MLHLCVFFRDKVTDALHYTVTVNKGGEDNWLLCADPVQSALCNVSKSNGLCEMQTRIQRMLCAPHTRTKDYCRQELLCPGGSPKPGLTLCACTADNSNDNGVDVQVA